MDGGHGGGTSDHDRRRTDHPPAVPILIVVLRFVRRQGTGHPVPPPCPPPIRARRPFSPKEGVCCPNGIRRPLGCASPRNCETPRRVNCCCVSSAIRRSRSPIHSFPLSRPGSVRADAGAPYFARRCQTECAICCTFASTASLYAFASASRLHLHRVLASPVAIASFRFGSGGFQPTDICHR